jgi:hypothetical protein
MTLAWCTWIFILLSSVALAGKLTRFQGAVSFDWNVTGNWDNGIPVMGDDVIVDMNGCASGHAESYVDVAGFDLKSLILQTELFKGVTTCSVSLVIKPGITLRAQMVKVQSGSKLSLNGGILISDSIHFAPGAYLAGSGNISATSVVEFNRSVVLPGTLPGLTGGRCWPFSNLVYYGDLRIVSPIMVANSSIFGFKNLALKYAVDLPFRTNPTLLHDTVTLIGQFTQFNSIVKIIDATCERLANGTDICNVASWPPDPIVMLFSELINLTPFLVNNDTQPPHLPPVEWGSCLFYDNGGGDVFTINSVGSGCSEVASSTLSILTSGSNCNAQATQTPGFLDPITTTTPSEGSMAENRGGLEAWVLAVAITIPVIVIGVGISIGIVVFHRRASAKYTNEANRKIAMKIQPSAVHH